MKSVILSTVLRTVLPPLLGAAGAIAATAFPAYYQAVCGGAKLPLATLPGLY